ncbi:DUF1456 family protein [Amphritea balenae]|uniref:DUF1456 family protein n=1 Tax=Amphritea balenae TaxID=452629 RepID=A0A3P1SQ93_9GAMM|nr:DUF1456 family protein [Amphritea balenae]RRC99293.1 DUF1456 family protein [Amphritea balenae]GGK72257.1 hypothetical protein GCM10007941_22890 [Amphritea balenae]
MTNNDILRRLRYSFNYSDTKMIALFRHAEMAVTREQLKHWLKKDDDPEYVLLPDYEMATFLNGLIIEKRGRQDGPQPVAERRLTNNIVFRKLKIALNLDADQILDMLKLAGFSVSKHELSALFRKQGHKNFRECKDQVLRNFLTGMQHQLRDKAPAVDDTKPLRKTSTEGHTDSSKKMRKPADRTVKFVVDKPPTARKPASGKPSESGFKWGKAPSKSKKSDY